MVSGLSSKANPHVYRWVSHSFETSAFRFQIVDGRLWVTHFPWAKYPDGVVPTGLTPWDKTNW